MLIQFIVAIAIAMALTLTNAAEAKSAAPAAKPAAGKKAKAAKGKVAKNRKKKSRRMIAQGVVAPKIYKAMTKAQKEKYLKFVRAAYVKSEIEMQKAMKYEFAGVDRFGDFIAAAKAWTAFLPYSYSVDGNACMLGGVHRNLNPDTGKCPTKGRSCGPEGSDNFECGAVFIDPKTGTNACVPRTPPKEIGRLCAESGTALLDQANYEKMKVEFQTMVASCDGTDATYKVDSRWKTEANEGCKAFKDAFAKLQTEYIDKDYDDGTDSGGLGGAHVGEIKDDGSLGEGDDGETPDIAAAAGLIGGDGDTSPPNLDSEGLKGSMVGGGTTSSDLPAGDDGEHSNIAAASNTVVINGANVTATDAAVTNVTPDTGGAPSAEAIKVANTYHDCNAMHAMIIEGGSPAGNSEMGLHENGVNLANSYKAMGATSVTYIPANKESMKKIEIPNKQAVDNLKSILAKPMSEPAMCGAASPSFLQMMMGTEPQLVDLDVKNYPKLNGAKFEYPDPTKETFLNSTNMMKGIDEIAKRCSGQGIKADQIVMVNIIGHGSANPCEIDLGGGKKLTAQQVRDGIMSPLNDKGVRVVFNIDAPGAACFKASLDSWGPGGKIETCVISSAKVDQLAFGADTLMTQSFGSLYPAALARTSNPMMASFCATLWDPFNAQAAVADPVNHATIGVTVAHDWKVDLKKASEEMGVFDLRTACPSPSGSGIKQPEGISQEQIKDLMKCDGIKSGLRDVLQSNGSVADAVLNSINGVYSEPPGVWKIVSEAKTLASKMKACNINLTKYKIPPAVVPNRADTGSILSQEATANREGVPGAAAAPAADSGPGSQPDPAEQPGAPAPPFKKSLLQGDD